jgi:release factor glutamine methyltransferase
MALVVKRLAREAEIRRLAALFRDDAIDLLHIPPLDQDDTYGVSDPASTVVRLLAQPRDAAAVDRALRRSGRYMVRTTDPRSRRGSRLYETDQVIVDVLDSIHVSRPWPRRLRTLERELRAGAVVDETGMRHPRPAALYALHAVESWQLRPRGWSQMASPPPPPPAPADLDMAATRRIAERAHVEAALRPPRRESPLLRRLGPIGARLREVLAMRRSGYGFLARPSKGRRVDIGPFEVDVWPGVFAPRLPITTRMIETAVTCAGGVHRPKVVEVGTGTGAIALAFARERPDASVVAFDISFRATDCARANRDRLGLPTVRISQGSLLDRLPARAEGQVDLVVSNIPYVPPATASATDWGAPVETVQGIDPDGLGLVVGLARRATTYLRPGGMLVLQIAGWQWPTLEAELRDIGYTTDEPVARGDRFAAIARAVWPGPRGNAPTIGGVV